jgi:ABC-2 type transport system ATP-binding protein
MSLASTAAEPTHANAVQGSRDLEPAIVVTDLVKTYKSGWFRPRVVTALRGVSLSVPRGEIFGLLGPNGAGKTTLIKTLLGIVRPTSGMASILEQPAGSMHARKRIGYLPENHRVPRHHTALTALEYFGGLSGLSPRAVRERRGPILEKLGIGKWGTTPVRQFSKGMQQRLGLAQALLHDPELLILDEPTDGVDPVGRAELRDLLVELRNAGKTIFLNSHHLQEMELLCDRVAMMDHGRMLKTGRVSELTSEPTMKVTLRAVEATARQALEAAQLPTIAAQLELLDETATEVTLRLPELAAADWDRAVDAWRAAGLSLLEVHRERRTLEETFLQVLHASRAIDEIKAS